MEQTILKLAGINKSFSGVKVLKQVSMEVSRGEVRGLVGENGAGKSTLMKILTGVYQKDSGTIAIDGQEVRIQTPLQAQKLGLSIIFQEMNLVDSLSIAENIFVGRLPKKGIRGIDWKNLMQQAQVLLDKVGLKAAPNTPVSELSIAGKQLVEIAKALSFQSKIIIMDEPSATLTDKELENLIRIIEFLRQDGVTVIYISHRLDEIFQLCDSVTVLRDGEIIDTQPVGNLTRETIIEKMVGREIDQEYPSRSGKPGEEVVLKVEDLTRKGVFQNISFEVHKGEILGIAGLVGSGRTEIVRSIFGADRLSSGTVWLHGKQVKITSPKQAIDHGIALVTEDRKAQGLVLAETIAKNTTLAALNTVMKLGFMDRRKENAVAEAYRQKMRTKATSVHNTCGSLSGGNQQKVVLSKWLYTQAEILILDEPTRGIDVGAKYEIYQLINQLVDEGKSVIMISSEMPEVISMSDRLLVVHEGRLKGELTGSDMTAENVMKLAIMEGSAV